MIETSYKVVSYKLCVNDYNKRKTILKKRLKFECMFKHAEGVEMDEIKKKQYQNKVEEITPKHNIWLEMIKAFFVGGIICALGQMIINIAMDMGIDQDTSASWCSLILVFLSALLTGLNIYPSIAKFGGAGALVPITGFANSICSPAIEFKKEGQVFGVGCKIFTIAGPVILYGIFTSWVLGLIYWIWGMVG